MPHAMLDDFFCVIFYHQIYFGPAMPALSNARQDDEDGLLTRHQQHVSRQS